MFNWNFGLILCFFLHVAEIFSAATAL